LLARLRAAHASDIKPYQLVNSFSATVSAAQATALAANPAVARIIPDVLIQGGPISQADPVAAKPAAASRAPRHHLTPHVIPDACAGDGAVQLDPEALQTTNTASANPKAATARSLGFTGAGVKVGFIADGLDPHNVNFIRPDGTSVFASESGGDYQDFSGDGTGQLTQGAEAFLDANSIAGQGIHVYNVSRFAAEPDPDPCDIRIEGVAPGAALVGLDVFGSFETTLESNFLQAINYAVQTDHVNVLNESFGSNPFPDSSALSVTKLFNDAAVAAGTTVTVSSGDSGSTSTIGSPASDPRVISVGASTAFRFYAQTNYAGARDFAANGWLDDNVSALSSGGFAASGGTIDLVAPGDLGFASCSRNVLVYQACLNLAGNPSPVELSGGTSEAAPLTAGAAALVIQAYRRTHLGKTPSPALVKQILVSTASDLGLPATEQGAGLLNTDKAVQLAESLPAGAVTPKPVGNTLLISRAQLNAVGSPGATRSWQVRVTNTGGTPQLISAYGRTFGANLDSKSGSVRLRDGVSPEFTDAGGLPNNYEVFHFSVPPEAHRLDAAISYSGVPNGDPDAPVWLTLIDPRGRFAADSIPQGTANYGEVDVRAPVPGRWTGVIFSLTGLDNGTTGRVLWQVASQRFTGFGQVSPARFDLPPGQSRLLRVTERTPPQAGDSAGAIVIRSDLGGFDHYLGAESQSIPVTLRSTVDLAAGGHFRGVLTGGNGREPGISQADYFQFHVGSGHRSLAASVSLPKGKADVVGAYLIAPDGQALGFGQNSLNGHDTPGLTAYALDPVSGTWTLAVAFTGPVAGDALSAPFTGMVALDSTKATAAGLPDSRKRLLPAGKRLTVRVAITNTGVAPEGYFADARLTKTATIDLESLTGDTFLLPLGVQPDWLVPSQTSSVTVKAKATTAVEFDWGPIQGDPDLLSTPTVSNQAIGTFTPSGGVVQPGNWVANPDQFGPYPHGAPQGRVTVTMRALAKAFDPTVRASTGDFWLASRNLDTPFEPVVIAPGKTGHLTVTIRPAGQPGTVVRGYLYVDDYLSSIPPFDQTAADELVAIPYAYTIK
jgi:subtilase family protein